MSNLRIVVGIPARMGSTRFPGKPLCDILGKTMIEHCYKRCSLSEYTTDLFVATCDSEIQGVVESFGGKVIMTNSNIERPGLRVAFAAETLNLNDDDIVVVVQGDEPLVHPDMIDLAVQPLLNEKDIFVKLSGSSVSLFSSGLSLGQVLEKVGLKIDSDLGSVFVNGEQNYAYSEFVPEDGDKVRIVYSEIEA